MAKLVEPQWLEPLLAGSLTPQQQATDEAAAYRSTLSLAQATTVAALAGINLNHRVQAVDPTVGTGMMLATAAAALQRTGHEVNAIGQDINAVAATAAAKKVETSASTCAIHFGDLLTETTKFEGSADLLVSEPPWGLSWHAQRDGVEKMVQRGHYDLGLGSQNDSSWLFVQRALDLLRPGTDHGARGVLLVTPQCLTDVPGRAIRKHLCQNDLLEAVVRLPEGLAANTQIPLYLLLIRLEKPVAIRGKVHIIDLQPFLTTTGGGRSRALRTEGLRVLWSSLALSRPGPSNRIVPSESFVRQQATVRREGTSTQRTWRIEAPRESSGEWLRHRYGPVEMALERHGQSYVNLRLDLSGARQAASKPWRTTRLSALLLTTPEVAAERTDHAAVSKTNTNLWLPVNGEIDASVTPIDAKSRVLQLVVDAEVCGPEFLAGWLNSTDGREARRLGLQNASTGTTIRTVRSDRPSLWRLMDEIEVPVPESEDQARISASALTLKRAETAVQQAKAELWTNPHRAELVAAQFDPLFDQSLERWSDSLPYPVATALWTLTSRRSVEAQHRQVFLTWESYAGFLAAVLVSVARQDADLAEVEGRAIRRTLDEKHLSLERASLGTWTVIIERLASTFRRMLHSEDPDEGARVQQLFGGATPSTIGILTASRCVELLREAGSRRNTWSGHSGAATEAALTMQIDQMMSLLEDLRQAVGTAWTGLPLVRAGGGRRKGGEYTQDIEMVMGTSAPFRPEVLRVGEMMDEGELYLATDGCSEPVPLTHLVVLRSSPQDQLFSCYFFNRINRSTARLVSYQMTEAGEIEEPLADLDLRIPWLLAPDAAS
ncbi:N-6 DNA methylase [Allobranchiibius sp. CTAmp26]|uniref:N-6 DNA methylase n=1 Tax=Allobranchiibius sp. CTAmp26 TaxID=2815214 RepID=UPI001AA1B928|nr:N-6 DNA methylase [Allobranchiibius sp. CTAmp26]MBO1753728.1 N-6 DNA methylase [Allobranchiibius sp. CTAmp26]